MTTFKLILGKLHVCLLTKNIACVISCNGSYIVFCNFILRYNHNGIIVETSADVINRYNNIEKAFPDSDAYLETIYVKNGAVYFTTRLGLYSIYAIDFVTLIVWILMYLVCAQKENDVLFKKSLKWVVVSLVVLMLATSFANYEILEEISLVFDKYNFMSAKSQQTISNLDYLFGFKNFLFDTAVGLVLIIAHKLSNKTDEDKQKTKIAAQIIRIAILIVVAFFLIVIKTLIVPFSSINSVDIETYSNHPIKQTEQFYSSTQTTTFSKVGSDKLEQICFKKINNKIFYNGVKLYEYNSVGNQSAYSYQTTGNKMITKGSFQKNTNTYVEFYLYKDEAICFVDNGKPMVIGKNDQIKEYNENLVVIFKEIIRSNNWEFFEQGANYLLKYDEEFIKPYLVRLSNGKFNQNEIKTLNLMMINDDYIQEKAYELTK